MIRKNDPDDIHTHGWPKFFHSLFMFITFPFRKPIQFVLTILFLLGLLYVPVLTHQVEPEDLLDWYKEQTEPFISSVKDGIENFKKEYFPQEPSERVQRRRPRAGRNREKQIKPAVENYTKKYDKQSAKKRKNEYVGDAVDKEYQFSLEEYENSAIRNTGRQNPYFGTVSRFNLKYPEEILEVKGEAVILNANELTVSDVDMFLFGIYTDPNSGNYEYAIKYLNDKVSGKKVRCEIMAYTAQDVATANCYIGVKSINDTLVSMGLAKKVW